MKNREQTKVSVLRMLISDIHNAEISKKSELSEEESVSVLMAAAKKRRDSINQFEGAGHTDRADAEKKELEIIQLYLPESMGEEELVGLVKRTVAEVQAASPGDFGKVMRVLMPRIKGRADGAHVSDMVKKTLEQKRDQ
jgi:uncharacterized protein YqeY